MMKTNRSPLAERMRPQCLGEIIGQSHLVGEKGFLQRLIKSHHLPSLILWGPPGCGKTTLAQILAQERRTQFYQLSAVLSGVKELRNILEQCEKINRVDAIRPVLFIDEIHRFNKGQQDALLFHVEKGIVTLIGATTENPSFEINSALLSRCRVVVLRPLSEQDLKILITQALKDPDKGLAVESQHVEKVLPEVWSALVQFSQGDARRALTLTEIAYELAQGHIENLTIEIIEQAAQHQALRYDGDGDQHYQIVSAFIKSMRGSDPDAALYWLARMLEGGEDPMFICRRMVIFASEDIGNADPSALAIAMHCTEALRFIGLPEGQLCLAQAVIHLALAPKSNRSMEALSAAQKMVKTYGPLPVPNHLVNAETTMMKKMGFGKNYDYPHNHPQAITSQTYFPEQLIGQRFYQPTDRGKEAELTKRLEWLNQIKQKCSF